MARFFFFLWLAAAACCCLPLLAPPVQARLGAGLPSGSGAGRGHPPLSGARVNVAAPARFSPGVPSTAKAKPAWSSSWTTAPAAAGRVRPELRAVPGGPDPLHHHGSPWRPELEPTTP